MKHDIKQIIQERSLIFDGGMGSLLTAMGVKFTLPDLLNLERPDVVSKIHQDYINAGSNIITTNTFSSSFIALSEHDLSDKIEEINIAACKIAREAIEKSGITNRPFFVAGELGPTSKLPTLSQITYHEMRDSYRKQVKGLLTGGVDIFLVGTSQDPLQIKAALAAIEMELQLSSLFIPTIVSVTTEGNGKLLVGATLESTLAAIEPYNPLAFGLNCSVGPDRMESDLHYLFENSPFPIICQPNAGLPHMVDGLPRYDLDPKLFGEWMEKFVNKMNISFLGGCCGTTPQHISELATRIEGRKNSPKTRKYSPSVSSLFSRFTLRQTPPPFIIAERTNVNGSKKFREALLSDDFQLMRAIAQESSKLSHALDINLAQAIRDETEDLKKLIPMVLKSSDAALVIDSNNPKAIEEALFHATGRSIINSINLEDGGKKAREILKLAAEFKSMVIALTIDEDGMAKSAKRKVEISTRLVALAQEFGLKESDILLDPLVFTLASGDEESKNSAVETLNAITEIKKKFSTINIILGISNVSYGLPANVRKYVNSLFLHRAIERGLDGAIINPAQIIPESDIPEDAKTLCEKLLDNDSSDGDPLSKLLTIGSVERFLPKKEDKNLSDEETLKERIHSGNFHDMKELISKLIAQQSAQDIVKKLLLPAMNEVGKDFGAGKTPLPFVLQSAEAMREAFNQLSPYIKSENIHNRGTLVLATVRGDVHDIGKNLVDIIISNNGFEVLNLGIRQPILAIMEAAKRRDADAIGLSGLLISSIEVMKEYLEILSEHNFAIPVIVGGAVLSQKIVDEVLSPLYKGGVYYCKDAFDGLKKLEGFILKDKEA
ncbi:MAG: homocysteine S-methyltransferase family protein [Pseudomonadota bacterium]